MKGLKGYIIYGHYHEGNADVQFSGDIFVENGESVGKISDDSAGPSAVSNVAIYRDSCYLKIRRLLSGREYVLSLSKKRGRGDVWSGTFRSENGSHGSVECVLDRMPDPIARVMRKKYEKIESFA